MKETEVVTVLGQRGSGKSSWVKRALPEIPRFIVWDTLGEYTQFDGVESVGELIEYVYPRIDGVFQVVINSMIDDDLEQVCRVAGAVKNLHLIVEEVDTYATPGKAPYELKRLLKIGRHYGVSMIFVSRRPAEINRLITSQSQRFIMFRMFEPGDIRYLKSIIGPEAMELTELKPLHYLDWNHGEITYGEIKFEKVG